jgi:hypothetical protein
MAMQDGANKKMKLYVKTLTGGSLTIEVNPDDTCYSIKERVAELMGGRPKEYREFEYYTKGDGLIDSLSLVSNNQLLEDDKTLEQYNIKNESLLYTRLRFGNRNCDIRLMCIANNVKFTVFIEYNGNKPYTVGQLKAKLSQYTSLTCTTLYLKKRDLEEFCKLENDDATLPLKDIYAILDGDIAIEPRTTGLHLYSTEDGIIVSGINDEGANEGDRYTDGHKKPFFSKPKSESIIELTPEQHKSLIKSVQANKQHIPNKSKGNHRYNFSNIVFHAAAVSLAGMFNALAFSYLLRISLPEHQVPTCPNFLFGTTAMSILTTALFGASSGAIIGGLAGYVYEHYFRSGNRAAGIRHENDGSKEI